MIYIYIAVHLSSMFLPNFGEIGPPVLEKKIFEGFFLTIYGYGGLIGHVTWIIYLHMYIGSLFLYMPHIKFGYDWPSGFREEDL